nr:hypothetical protein [Saccharolobus solfataricus]
MTQINKRKKLESILRHLRGISFVGVNVSLSWGEDRPSLISIMDGVDSSVDKVVLAF